MLPRTTCCSSWEALPAPIGEEAWLRQSLIGTDADPVTDTSKVPVLDQAVASDTTDHMELLTCLEGVVGWAAWQCFELAPLPQRSPTRVVGDRSP